MTINRPHLIVKRSFFSIFYMTNVDFNEDVGVDSHKDPNSRIPTLDSRQKARLEKRKKVTRRNRRVARSSILFALLAIAVALFAEELLANFSFLKVLEPYLAILPVPFILVALVCAGFIAWEIIKNRAYSVEFYDTFVIIKDGVFKKTEDKQMFPKIVSCHVALSLRGRILKYGDIYINAIGTWNVDLDDIKNPRRVRRYIENHFISAKEIRAIRQTILTQ